MSLWIAQNKIKLIKRLSYKTFSKLKNTIKQFFSVHFSNFIPM